MKKLILFLILIPSFVFAGTNPYIIGIVSQVVAPLFTEGFEGTGYENEGWSESVPSGATVDEDYATSPLVGSQSLQIVGGTSASAITGKTFTASSEIWHHTRVSMATTTPASERPLTVLRDSGGSTISNLAIRTDGAVRVYHGSQTDTTAASFVASDTAYHMLFRYVTGTGLDGVVEAWIWAVGGSKPETPTLSISNGSAATDPVLFRLYAGVGMTNVYDQVIVSTTEPTL